MAEATTRTMQPPAGPAGDFAGIQMLRAIAALAVVVHHTLQFSRAVATLTPDWVMDVGAAGVDVFFVISGFIMLHTSFRPGRPPMPPGRFLLRRVIRIYPLYWLCAGVMLAVMAAGFLQHNQRSGTEIAFSLALLPSSRLILPVAWTLVFEIYFYLVFAASLLLRSATASLLATGGAILLLQLAGQHHVGPFAGMPGMEPFALFLTAPIASEFILGLALAWAIRKMALRPGVVSPSAAFCLALLGFAMLGLAAALVPHPAPPAGAPIPPDALGAIGWWRVLGWGCPAVLVAFAFLAVPSPRGWLGRSLVLLGDASYALYLGHGFVMDGYGVALRHAAIARLQQGPVVLAVVALSIGVGLALHFVVEQPLLRLLRGWSERGTSTRAPRLARPVSLRQQQPEAALPLP
jgi:peptidoglycan/LPS O-acetylase OafA/YrhL